MDVLQAVLLGIVQGITEWLPISSSGHLAIVQDLLKIEVPVLFDILLHVGTLLAVLLVFRKDIINILKAVAKLDFKSEDGKLAVLIVIATIPTAIIGFFFKKLFESSFSSLSIVGAALIATGCFLFICERWPGKKELGTKEAVLMGIAQGMRIPGLSRSGTTIGTGLLAGVDKEKVAKFSFLISIPEIIGAAILDFKKADISSVGILPYIVGFAVAAIVGYLAILFLLDVIRKQKLHWFAIYCWILGAIIVLGKVFNIL
jgi:undecaprenyl-diphosphatase